MKVIQELVSYFDARGKLSRTQLRKLLADNQVASDAPSTMQGLCDRPGASYYFRVTGTLEGTVWGSDIYGHDSQFAAAVVHAGAVKPGETGYVKMTCVPPVEKLVASERHGVTSSAFGAFPYVFRVEAV